MTHYLNKPWVAQYSEFVPEELFLPTRSLVDILEEHAEKMPSAPAIYYFEEKITFEQLNEYASRFATLLERWGIGKGDRVALYLQNNPQFLIALYAAWKRGAVVVPLNPMLKEKELEYHLNDSGAKALVCLESLYEVYGRNVVANTEVARVVTTSEFDFLPHADPSMRLSFNETIDLMSSLEQVKADTSSRVAVTVEDMAFLVYTSGTTGQPKGAISLHRNIAFNAETYRTWMRLDETDIILGMAPLFHITGIVGHVAVATLTGIPLVLFHRFHAEEALRMVQRYRPTMSVASITAYIALMNASASGAADFSSLQKCYSGGAPIAPSLTEQFERKMGVYIHNIYGLTESNSPTHAVPLGGRAPVDPQSGALSIGVPVPGCDAKLIDLEDPNREVALGQPGEFAVKGPMIFSGYWGKPEATVNAFHDGYFLTGDVAVMDEQGWFYVVDRKKDMIIASGFKVWPREIEDTLYLHPAVKEAAVVGVPDPYRGETVKAFVSLKDEFQNAISPGELIEFCKERLASYKYPRFIEILAEVPKTATGKFLRRQLRG